MEKKSLLYFTATWCGPCKAFSPIMASFENVRKVDVDLEPDMVRDYSVTSVPTVVAIDEKGSEIGRIRGLQSKSSMVKFLASIPTG